MATDTRVALDGSRTRRAPGDESWLIGAVPRQGCGHGATREWQARRSFLAEHLLGGGYGRKAGLGGAAWRRLLRLILLTLARPTVFCAVWSPCLGSVPGDTAGVDGVQGAAHQQRASERECKNGLALHGPGPYQRRHERSTRAPWAYLS